MTRPREDLRIPPTADERQMLLTNLRRGRAIVEWKLSGCDDAALRAARTPGGMDAHGVLKHLENVERWWFRGVLAGDASVTYDWTEDDPDAEFKGSEPIEELLDRYRAEVARCDEVIGRTQLDDLASSPPPGRPAMSLRWILLHMIEETARHLGHLDVLREMADGSTGDLPMEPE